ncbi:MAG: proprotein convertase P-domain-containing protein [Ardenticatenaceae bacterium]|nr:proprotein convertase P-domain-containing protein [Ardenticatenaceae bacterium]
MKRERVLVIVLIVTAVLTLMTASLVTAAALADDEPVVAGQPQQKEAPPTEALSGGQLIVMTKTVGLGAECASTKTIVVSPGTAVTYCYRVANTGNVTLTVHDLTDSELGTVLADFSFTLAPGGSAALTQTAVINTSTVNTATWTAANPGPTDTVAYVDGATVIANYPNTCRTPNLSIPDNNVTGTLTTMNLNGLGTLTDLDVYLEVEHTWVGDLRFTLEHVDTGTAVELINRPGNPATTFGCSSDNMRAIVDDEAASAVETSCGTSNLALAGRYVGGDPADNGLLTAFDGEDLAGEWELRVSDNAAGDSGTLQSWCLLPTLAAPDISVVPSALTATQPPNVQTQQMLSIRNSGDMTLTWMVHESYEVPVAQRPILSLLPPLTGEAGTFHKAAAAADEVWAASESRLPQPVYFGPVAAPPTQVLYDNGPLVTMPGAGAGGADASVVQNSLGLSSFGYAHQIQGGNTVADDFTVTDANGWYVAGVEFFAYQTGSTLSSTMTAVNYRIWDGPPDDPGSSILINPGMDNSLVDTAWSGIYRVDESIITATTRPVMQNTASGGFVLPPGTYWLEWQSDGSQSLSGPWVPLVTISGVVTTGNALQYFNDTWVPVTSGGHPQGLPFVLSGYPLADIPWATVDPVSGTLPSGVTEVMVTFDSTGLMPGVYTGTLLVAGNDPDEPVVSVPLTLTVELHQLYLPFVTKP